jgi:hypothetical protein
MQHTISALEYVLDDFSDYTDSAFLVAALRWTQEQGVWQPFKRLLSIDMKTVVYSPLHKVQTLVASILVGCQFNKDINTRLVPDRVAAALLGLERFPDQSQCNVLLRRLDQTNLSELAAIHAEHLRRYEPVGTAPWRGYQVVDIDQCGLVAEGKHYELARKGYFPRRRGVQGYQLSLAWLGQRQLVLGLRLDPGNVHCSVRLRELVELSAAHLGKAHGPVIYRIDGGYGTQPQIKWLLAGGRLFLAKGAIRAPEKWARAVPTAAWQRVAGATGVRVAETASGPQVRGIVCEVTAPSGVVHYSVLLTNLPCTLDAVTLWRLYNGRQTIEAFFKTGRHVYGMSNLRSRAFTAIAGFLWLVCITHNLRHWIKQALFAESEWAAVSTRQLVEQVGRLPARRERTPGGWRLHLPSHHHLARLFVEALRPQWVQLSLRL